jgi:hypothetical protein
MYPNVPYSTFFGLFTIVVELGPQEPPLFVLAESVLKCSETGFGPGSNIKCNTKVKNKKLDASFPRNNVASSIKMARFCTIFCCLKSGLNKFGDPELEPEPEPDLKLFKSRNRNRNDSLLFHNTAKIFPDLYSEQFFTRERKYLGSKQAFSIFLNQIRT